MYSDWIPCSFVPSLYDKGQWNGNPLIDGNLLDFRSENDLVQQTIMMLEGIALPETDSVYRVIDGSVCAFRKISFTFQIVGRNVSLMHLTPTATKAILDYFAHIRNELVKVEKYVKSLVNFLSVLTFLTFLLEFIQFIT
jgi:hypothetical protein